MAAFGEGLEITKKSIINALIKPETILFIGSGPSIEAGLPTWGQLLTLLIEFCKGRNRDTDPAENALKEGRLEDAASFIFDLETKAELAKYLKEEIHFFSTQPVQIHQKLLQFGLRSFLTPNYDNLIEQSLEISNPGLPQNVVTNDDKAALHRILRLEEKNFIYKFHGCLSKPDSIVLSNSDYIKLMHSHPHVKLALQTIFTSRSIVIIGAGLNDRDTNFLFEEINEVFGSFDNNIYAICPNIDKPNRDLIKKTRGINVISYKSIDHDHSGLIELLDEMHGEIVAELKKPTVTTESNLRLLGAVEPNLNDDAMGRLLELGEEDTDERKRILSILFWVGPQKLPQIVDNMRKLTDKINPENISSNVERLVLADILKKVGELFLPVDEKFISTIAAMSITDAAKLLEGNENE